MKRITPSRKMKQEVEEVFTGWETEGHPRATATLQEQCEQDYSPPSAGF